jgi:hypothetical protein
MRKSLGSRERTLYQASQVLTSIQKEPGITMPRLATDLGLKYTVLKHKLSYLQDSGKVYRGDRIGKEYTWYPTELGYLDIPHPDVVAELQSDEPSIIPPPLVPSTITLPLTILYDPESSRALRLWYAKRKSPPQDR